MTNKSSPSQLSGGPAKQAEARDDFDMADLMKQRRARHAAQNDQAKKDRKELDRQEEAARQLLDKSTANSGA